MPIDALEPDEVLALRFDEAAVADELAAWSGGHVERTVAADGTPVVTVWVPTPTGPRPAVLGDWIVRHAEEVHDVVAAKDFVAGHVPAGG